jgi:hypothetical protein
MYRNEYIDLFVKVQEHRNDKDAWKYWQEVVFMKLFKTSENEALNKLVGSKSGSKLSIPIPDSF